MSPQQAIQLLDQATSLLQLNRQDHQSIQLALNILRLGMEKETKSDKPVEVKPAKSK